MSAPTPPRSLLLPIGWASVVVVAALAYAAKPEDELGFSLVLGSLALAMAVWTARSRSRVAALMSLVLGILCALLFGGYAFADVTGGDASLLVAVGDLIGLLGGLALVAGAADLLRHRRRTLSHAATAGRP